MCTYAALYTIFLPARLHSEGQEVAHQSRHFLWNKGWIPVPLKWITQRQLARAESSILDLGIKAVQSTFQADLYHGVQQESYSHKALSTGCGLCYNFADNQDLTMLPSCA